MITQARLKKLFTYNPDTGHFTLNEKRLRSPKGAISGYRLKSGYIQLWIDYEKHTVHRMAFLYMTGEIPKYVDHINHDRSDNRWANLRPATVRDNNTNIKKQRNNTSGVTGVTWSTRDKRWIAQIKVNYKNIVLGYFKSKTDAISARKTAEIKYGFHKNHGL